jgi:hypothetical protein
MKTRQPHRTPEEKAADRAKAKDLVKEGAQLMGVSEKIAQHIILDAQGVNPEGRNKSARELSAGWAVAEDKMRSFIDAKAVDFPLLKRQLGGALGKTLAIGMDSLMGDLNNSEVMARQTPEQKARIIKLTADAWITVMEGLGEKSDSSTKDVKEMMLLLQREREELQELKKANARVVENPIP